MTRLAFPTDKLEPVARDNNALNATRTFAYEGSRVDIPGGAQAKDILMLRLLVYKDMSAYLANTPIMRDIYVKDANAYGTLRAPQIDVHLTLGEFNDTVLSIAKDPSFGGPGEAGVAYRNFDFTTPILARTDYGATITYDDYTSRLGKPKSTAFYRMVPDPTDPGTEKFILVKKDTMRYAHEAPSVDTRFIPDAFSQPR